MSMAAVYYVLVLALGSKSGWAGPCSDWRPRLDPICGEINEISDTPEGSVINGRRYIKATVFGALPSDGKDDSIPLREISRHLSRNSDVSVVFPEGTYQIDHFVEASHRNQNHWNWIHKDSDRKDPSSYQPAPLSRNLFLFGSPDASVCERSSPSKPRPSCSCVNNHIIGCKARIENFAGFRFRYIRDGKKAIQRDIIAPFTIWGCKDSSLQGFELDGNVDELRVEKKDFEGPQRGVFAGVITANTRNFRVSDMCVHHYPGDGFYHGRPLTEDEDLVVERSISANNARNGMSISHAVRAQIRDMKFVKNGHVKGRGFPKMPPSVGFGIEPNTPNGQLTTQILLESPLFRDNASWDVFDHKQFYICSKPGSGAEVGTVVLKNVRDSFHVCDWIHPTIISR